MCIGTHITPQGITLAAPLPLTPHSRQAAYTAANSYDGDRGDQEHRGRQTKDGIRIYEPRISLGCTPRAAGCAILDDMPNMSLPGRPRPRLTGSSRQSERAGAKSATIGYKGYQHASCISLNHVVCHGIPGDKKLKDGDILNIDVTVIVDGWFGDTSSRMYVAGKLPRKAERSDPT